MNIDKKAIGQRIKSLRQSKGMTLEEFGKLFNASKSIVLRWENGTAKPNAERTKAIAKIADITVDELLYGIRADEMEQLKLALSDVKKITTHPEHFDVSPETEEELLKHVYEFALKSPRWRDTPFNILPLLPMIEDTFEAFYHDINVTNTSAYVKALDGLHDLIDEITKYFMNIANIGIIDKNGFSSLHLSLYRENLDNFLGYEILSILGEALERLEKIGAVVNKDIPETIKLTVTGRNKRPEQLSFNEFTEHVNNLFIKAMRQDHPSFTDEEITELAKQKLSQHHEYILDFYNSNYSS